MVNSLTMRIFRKTLLLGLLILACSGCASAAGDSAAFKAESLGDGVWLFLPADPAHARTNSLVVERDDGLLVVDSQPSPAAARDLIAAIRRKSTEKIRYLVLSHPHAESSGGASAFPDDTLVIGSKGCREALLDESYDFGAEVRARFTTDGEWDAPPRRAPILELLGNTRLADTRNPIEIWPLRQGHSRGDVMVVLEHLDLMHTGAIVFPDRNPYPSPDTVVEEWLRVLNQISRRAPKTIVGLYGSPLEVLDIRRQRDAFAWAQGQVTEGFVDRLPLETIKQNALEAPGLEKFFGAEGSFAPLIFDKILEERQAQAKRGGG